MSCRIVARARGPLAVEGDFVLVGLDGQPLDVEERRRVLLCRCGGTKSAPLCDGTHYRNGFEAPTTPEPDSSTLDDSPAEDT